MVAHLTSIVREYQEAAGSSPVCVGLIFQLAICFILLFCKNTLFIIITGSVISQMLQKSQLLSLIIFYYLFLSFFHRISQLQPTIKMFNNSFHHVFCMFSFFKTIYASSVWFFLYNIAKLRTHGVREDTESVAHVQDISIFYGDHEKTRYLGLLGHVDLFPRVKLT